MDALQLETASGRSDIEVNEGRLPTDILVKLRPLISIVIPTFNERENILALLEEIDVAMDGIDYEAVIVDDSSDDTPNIVRESAGRFPARLIHREGDDARKGLASAVVEGFQASRGKYLCVIDADLQHPPAIIPTMLQKAQLENADIVVPSRYIAGGSYEGLDNALRKFASVGLKELARLVFFPKLNKVSDPLSGFFLVRTDLLTNKDLHPKGFKILLEILVRCEFDKVSQVPYVFRARQNGTSKASMKQGLSYFQHLGSLLKSVPSAGRFYKFGLVGATGLVVNLGLIALLQSLPVSIAVAAVWGIAKAASIGSNFLLNRAFTFRDRVGRGRRTALKDFSVFTGASAAGVLIDLALVFTLRHEGLTLLEAEAIAIPAAMLANFALTSRFAFRPRRAPLGSSRAQA